MEITIIDKLTVEDKTELLEEANNKDSCKAKAEKHSAWLILGLMICGVIISLYVVFSERYLPTDMPSATSVVAALFIVSSFYLIPTLIISICKADDTPNRDTLDKMLAQIEALKTTDFTKALGVEAITKTKLILASEDELHTVDLSGITINFTDKIFRTDLDNIIVTIDKSGIHIEIPYGIKRFAHSC